MAKRDILIYGAGAIGGTIGARLHQAGVPVTLIARGEHARVLKDEGLTLIDVKGSQVLSIPVIEHPAQWSSLQSSPPASTPVVLMCMKTQHTLAALTDLRSAGLGTASVVCVQNGVANEALALRRFADVHATVVNLPAMHLNPGEVVTHGTGSGGILDTGRYPSGSDATTEYVVDAFRAGGFSAVADKAVMRWKYAKLLRNLGNVLQAVLSDVEAAADIIRQLRGEALACYQAAQIDCASRDEVRDRQQGVYGMGDIPGVPRTGGSSWQSMARGTGDVETEYLNGEICLLGRLHGVPTPANDACVYAAYACIASQQGPGQFSAGQLQTLIDQGIR